ncbi:hypothetical protein D9M70_577320 [compost metagenome]
MTPAIGAVMTRTNIGSASTTPISKSLIESVLSHIGKYGIAKPLTINGAQKSKAMRSAKWRGGGPTDAGAEEGIIG